MRQKNKWREQAKEGDRMCKSDSTLLSFPCLQRVLPSLSCYDLWFSIFSWSPLALLAHVTASFLARPVFRTSLFLRKRCKLLRHDACRATFTQNWTADSYRVQIDTEERREIQFHCIQQQTCWSCKPTHLPKKKVAYTKKTKKTQHISNQNLPPPKAYEFHHNLRSSLSPKHTDPTVN